MTLTEIWKLLPRGLAIKLFLMISIQQLIVASATWALGEAGLHLADGQGFFVYVILFLILSLLPQVFTLGIKKLESEGYWQAYGQYLNQRLLSHARKAELWQNHDRKETFQTAIGPDAESYLTAVLFSVFDIYLFALTITLNITALTLVVDGLFPWAFALSGVLSLAVFQVSAKRINRSIESEQESKIEFFSYLLKCWDNVFLNNATVERNYRTNLLNRLNKAGHEIGQSRLEVETSTLLLTLVSHLPIFALIIYLVIRDQNQAASLTALLITIPRQMHVLTNFRFLFEQINGLISFKARARNSWKNSELSTGPRGRIQISKISMNGKALHSVAQTVSDLKTLSAGRVVITGANGAGKSTLLLKLNAELENSFYMPANPQLEIGLPLGVESTGERILKHLDAAIESGSKYLLLDEWDANLDLENRALIHTRLDQMCADRVVVEIRHHSRYV